ncbi:GGDEF domain-containing protein [Caenispirillum bisanense]|uniref:GGDEF domain-containing protein n=1 Tax=Caenispirillum bisanense TaxID=414052 RepID=UPI0031DCAC00
MADINRPPPSPPVSWNGGGNPQQQGRRRAFRQAVDAYGGTPLVEPQDTLSIHGIPPRDLTEPVRRVIDDLMAEIERLRWAVEQSEGRQAYLEGLADRDSVLPVLNRRAFEREVGLLIGRLGADPASPPPVLAAFYLENFEELHLRLGLDAAETALRHVAETLLTHVRQSDVVGALGGAGVGVVLTLADEAAVREKAARLRQAVSAWPPRHSDAVLPLAVRFGLVRLRGDMSVAHALALVDDRLRQGLDDAMA